MKFEISSGAGKNTRLAKPAFFDRFFKRFRQAEIFRQASLPTTLTLSNESP
jgi:hypothetical protein